MGRKKTRAELKAEAERKEKEAKRLKEQANKTAIWPIANRAEDMERNR